MKIDKNSKIARFYKFMYGNNDNDLTTDGCRFIKRSAWAFVVSIIFLPAWLLILLPGMRGEMRRRNLNYFLLNGLFVNAVIGMIMLFGYLKAVKEDISFWWGVAFVLAVIGGAFLAVGLVAALIILGTYFTENVVQPIYRKYKVSTEKKEPSIVTHTIRMIKDKVCPRIIWTDKSKDNEKE